MAKSRSKYTRQGARAKVRNRRSRRGGVGIWWVLIAVVLVVGLVAIVISRSDKASGGDYSHRHAAFGVNVCGTWEPDPPQTPGNADGSVPIARHGTDTYAGIHTHGDGLIHFEPDPNSASGRDDLGSKATVGRFFDYNGWTIDTTSISYNGGLKMKNGDKCPSASEFAGKPVELRWAVAKDGGSTLKEQQGNIADYAPADGDVIGIFFVPKDADLSKFGAPPSLSNLPNAKNIESPAQIPPTPATSPITTAPSGIATTSPAATTAAVTPTSTP